MIKSAENFAREIAIEEIWAKDDPDNELFFAKRHHIILDNDDSKSREYVSLDKSGNVIGFIKYLINCDLGFDFEEIIFDKDCEKTFLVDIKRVIAEAFEMFCLSEINWRIHKSHPMLRKFTRLIFILNGKIVPKPNSEYLFYKITREGYSSFLKPKTE